MWEFVIASTRDDRKWAVGELLTVASNFKQKSILVDLV